MKNAVIYARYSSAGQREQSIEDQIEDCKKYADNHDFRIVGIYADYAKTGTNSNREEFQKMLSDSKKERFEAVLVWKLDRFGRNREEMAINRLTLKKSGVSIISCMENIPDDPTGVILEGMIESLNEYYSLNLAENVKRGLGSNAKKAMVNGPLPYGYKNENGFIVVDKEKAPVVKKVFQLFLDGYTRREIKDILNQKHILTNYNNPFSYNSINNMLKNPRYTGNYIFKDTIIKDAYEALVSEEDFYKTQEILQSHSYHKRLKTDEYYLSGIIKCGICGSHYTSETGTSKTGRVYHYYKCSKKKKDSSCCPNDVLNKAEFEEAIFETILKEILNDSIIDRLVESVTEKLSNNDTSLIPQLEKQKEDLYRKNSNLLKALENGNTSDLIFNRIKSNEQKIEDLKFEIYKEKIKHPPLTPESVRWALENLKISDLKSNYNKSFLVHHFINSIVYKSGIVTMNFNICYVDSQGKLKSMTKSSTNYQMADCEGIILNSTIYHEDGTFSYSFNYRDWLKSA